MQALGHAVAVCAVIVFSIARVRATQFSTDQTDIYWNPGESGWGMQVVQEADTILVHDDYDWFERELYLQGHLCADRQIR